MNLKSITLTMIVTALAAVYAVYFTDWFRPKNIQIITQVRPMLQRGATQGVFPVAFGLNAKYQLTSIQVFPAKELATNDLTPPVWALTGDPKSAPVKAFSYAGSVSGMKPMTAGMPVAPLHPGEEYVLLVEAEGRTGKTNFFAGGKIAPVVQAAAGPAGLVPLAPPPPGTK